MMKIEHGLILACLCLLQLLACGSRPPPASPGATASVEPVSVPTEFAVEEDEPPVPTSSAADAEAAVPVLSDDPVWGEVRAPVTIVEFADYQCPFSFRVQETLDRIRQTYGPQKVRIVWKNSPLPFHTRARPTHEAAMAVHRLGGNPAFWAFHERAFAGQKDLSDENLTAWAREAGIDSGAFHRVRGGQEVSAHIERDLALASAVGARGTPIFRINGVEVRGAQPFEKFREVIEAELSEVRQLVRSGVPWDRVYATRAGVNARARVEDPAAAARLDDDTRIYAVPVERRDPVQGPADAPVTVVVFSDFQCPFCKRVLDTLVRLRSEYPQDLRLVWKDNPLPFHPRARPAATLARFAYQAQGNAGFWRAHDLLFESQANLEDADLELLATRLKLPWDKVRSAIEKDRFAGVFEASQDVAADFKAAGTPHFFVNGYRLSGVPPYEKFHEVVEQQLARARGLLAAGTPKARIYAALIKDGVGPVPPETKAVPAPPRDAPFRGPANARVVVQHWSDFQCPFCARVVPTLRELEKKYPGRVKIVWRNLPLPFHQHAELAAEAALEARAQRGNAGFWRFHDALFAAQKQPGGLERPSLEAIAQAQGLDLRKFRAALDAHTHLARIKEDTELANQHGIQGTPATVVGKVFVSGAQPLSAFRKAFEQASKP